MINFFLCPGLSKHNRTIQRHNAEYLLINKKMIAKIVYTFVYQRGKGDVFNIANHLFCLGNQLNSNIYDVDVNIMRIIILK